MDFETLKSIFENKYDRTRWIDVLRNIFNVTDVLVKPLLKDKGNPEWGPGIYQIGSFETLEGRLVGIYEVPVNHKIKLERHKVGLRELLKNIYKHEVDAAFVVFDQGGKWRFSYISEISTKDPVTKKRIRKATDPKRYTYILGEGERCKTATDRFLKVNQTEDLFTKGVSLAAIEEAFNVDKLSKSFFDGYRKIYGEFTAYLTGKDENNKEKGKAHPFLKSVFNGHEKEARDFVKKMMGRIVFLYFLEKKGWLGVPEDKKWGDGDEMFLSNLFKDCNQKANYYQQVLIPLFFETLNKERKDNLFKIKAGIFDRGQYHKLQIPFLNGGLFDNEENEGTNNLVFKADMFRDMFAFFDQYNFTVYEDSPDEHTVAVDPEMLGHIFENLLEDNKDKGAYYTPKEIVHYMCQESLIEYLYTKLNPVVETSYHSIDNSQADMFGNKSRKGQLKIETAQTEVKEIVPRGAIEKLIKHKEAGDIIDHDEAVLTALRDVKICDPAIGSGAFPMGLLHEVFYVVELLHEASPDVTYKVWELKEWEPAKVKLAVIQNSIYGVDIEQGAVDIARLRFWLSLVVDEDEPQPLPNLDYKIVVGDSLLPKLKIDGEEEVIDIDWKLTDGSKAIVNELHTEQKKKLIALKTKQHMYFNVKVHKATLHREIEDLKADILINQLTISKTSYAQNTPEKGGFAPTAKEKEHNLQRTLTLKKFDDLIAKLKAAKKRKEDIHFFDWKLNFPEVMTQGVAKGETGFDIVIGNPPYLGNKEIGEKRQKSYEKKFGFKDDMYNYFFIISLENVKSNCAISFITSNTFLSLSSKRELRKKLLSNKIIEIFNVGYVFNAFVDTVITRTKKVASPIEDYTIIYKRGDKDFSTPITENVNAKVYRKALNNVLFFPNKININLYNKYNESLVKLHTQFWHMISDMSKVKSNVETIQDFVEKSKPNEVFLLGMLCEGAQGLVTGNNSRYLSVICDDKKQELEILRELNDRLVENGVNFNKEVEIENKTSFYNKAEKLKTDSEKPAILGKFFLYKTILRKDVKKFQNLSKGQKENGTDNETWVYYQRGNELGLKWYVDYSEAIIWDKKSVKELREGIVTNSRFQGYEFYHREGFAWVDYFTSNIKAFFLEEGPYSKNVVKFSSTCYLSNKYFVGILNSKFISYYIKNFVTTTHTLQINDGKLIPIVIPSKKNEASLVKNVNQILVKKSSNIESDVSSLEAAIDLIVYKLYELSYEEACTIEGNTEWMSKEEYDTYEVE